MLRITLDYFVVIWLFMPIDTLAAEMKIGSSDILLPKIDGFELITQESPGIHAIASRLAQECDGEQCGLYTGEPSRVDLIPNTRESFLPLFLVDILDDELVVQSGEFAGFMQWLKADTKALLAHTAASFTELKIDVNINSPEGSELVLVSVSAEVSEEFFETETYLAIPAYGDISYKRIDGSIVSYPFHAVAAFILVRDKILLTQLFVPEDSSDCSRSTFERIVEQLKHANIQ